MAAAAASPPGGAPSTAPCPEPPGAHWPAPRHSRSLADPAPALIGSSPHGGGPRRAPPPRGLVLKWLLGSAGRQKSGSGLPWGSRVRDEGLESPRTRLKAGRLTPRLRSSAQGPCAASATRQGCAWRHASWGSVPAGPWRQVGRGLRLQARRDPGVCNARLGNGWVQRTPGKWALQPGCGACVCVCVCVWIYMNVYLYFQIK